jgi:hypothetical protein
MVLMCFLACLNSMLQAMADYAELIWELKQQYNASNAPVIGGCTNINKGFVCDAVYAELALLHPPSAQLWQHYNEARLVTAMLSGFGGSYGGMLASWMRWGGAFAWLYALQPGCIIWLRQGPVQHSPALFVCC